MFQQVMQVYLIILSVCLAGALFLDATSILDIDIVYALLSFQAVVVLSRLLRVRMLAQKKKGGKGK